MSPDAHAPHWSSASLEQTRRPTWYAVLRPSGDRPLPPCLPPILPQRPRPPPLHGHAPLCVSWHVQPFGHITNSDACMWCGYAHAQDVRIGEAKNLMRRKNVQLENMRVYDEAIVTLKAKVRELEGQDMRETIQDRVNSWFVEKRDMESGDYPEFPEPEDGGSKVILNPPLPSVQSLLEDQAGGKGKDGKGKAPAKKDTKKGGKVRA
eukprot:355754-Chlamydomonas_euryale.AAC.1